MSNDGLASQRNIPSWVVALNVLTIALGVFYIARGAVVFGAVLAGTVPAAYGIRYLLTRGQRSRSSETPQVMHGLGGWAVTFLGTTVAVVSVGTWLLSSGLALGAVVLAAAVAPAYIAARLLQSRSTVRAFIRRHGSDPADEIAVLVGRDTGVRGLFRRPVVVATAGGVVAVARASFGETYWHRAQVAGLSKVEIYITGAAGHLELAAPEFAVRLTAIPAKQLKRAEAILRPR